MEATVLLKEELELLQQMSKDYTNAKNALGDLELKKHDILNDIDAIRKVSAENEKKLISKYGIDSVINIQTGEITKKKQE
jgi:predicted  nucleic acid-binding Zn-ribbon protein